MQKSKILGDLAIPDRYLVVTEDPRTVWDPFPNRRHWEEAYRTAGITETICRRGRDLAYYASDAESGERR